MKSKLILSALLVILCSAMHGQSYQYDNVKHFTTRSMGEIIQNQEVKGYYVFYPVEKVDRKTIAFKISLLDDNLNQVSEFNIERPKKYLLIESSFNQNAFVFNFYDPKSRSMEYVTFDRSGKELGSVTTDKLSSMERATLAAILQNPETTTSNIFPVDDSGFIRYATIDQRKDGYSLTRYDNNLKEIWSYKSDPDSKLIENGSVLSVNKDYILVQVTKLKSLLTSKFDTYLVLLDAHTGKAFYNFQMQDDNEAQLSVLNAFMIDDDGTALMMGEYYAPGDNVLKDKSIGLYARGVEKNGEYSFFKKYGWDREIANLKKEVLSDEEKEKDKGTNQIFFHKFIRSENGHVFAIAEQFRKQASAVGIASTILNGGNQGGAATVEIKVTNMVVAEFDTDLNLIDYQIIPKKRTRVLLPAGMGLLSAQKLGFYIKSTGGFDYNFTSMNREKDNYHAIYTDFNRRDDESNEKSDAMVGTINIEDGKVSNERFPLNTDGNLLWFSPAKPGYVLINEYFRKGKKLKMHLEKVMI